MKLIIKNKYFQLLSLFVSLIVFSSSALSEETISVKHYQKQERYQFGVELLDLALSKLGKPYKIQGPDEQNMNEARGEFFVINGNLDLEFMSVTEKRVKSMIPIKFPIYRGLLGLRLPLVTKENKNIFAQIQDVEGLRELTAVHGKHWGDVSIYSDNNLKVITHVSYDRLFNILIKGSIKLGKPDYFHRGINEIWPEQEKYADDLVIADGVMLYYEMPVYYFVSKARPELAKQIEKGLNIAYQDGSYYELFMKHYKGILDKGDLKNRNLIVLKNNNLPPNTPSIDKSWWLPKHLDATLSSD